MIKMFFILWLFLPGYGISQTAKLTVSKIEIAVYEYNSHFSQAGDKADIILYCQVSKSGNVQVQYQHDSITEIFKFELPENVISDINLFFKNKKGLKDCRENAIPEIGINYGARQYYYFRIIGGDNKIESACYIEEFMIESFNELILEITNLYADKSPVPGSAVIVTPEIVKQISDLHKRTKSLARTSEPPPVEEIKEKN